MEKYLENEKILYSSRGEKEKEFDFVLAEYMPGIARIVSTIAEVEKCHFNQAEGTVSANVKFNIIYISDFGDKIKNAFFNEVITCSLEDAPSDKEGVVYICSCFISSESARLVSSRKVTAKCLTNFNVTGLACEKETLFCKDEDSTIYVQTKDISCLGKTTLPEVCFETANEIAIGENQPAVGEIIYSFACPRAVSARAENGYIDIGFVLSLYAIYEPGGDDEAAEDKYCVLNSEITVNQKIENEKVSESSVPYVFIDVPCCSPSVSFDPYGENKIISFTSKYCVNAFIYDERECEIITDAFGEEGVGDAVFSEIALQNLSARVKSKVSLTEKMSMDISAMRSISACKARVCQVWTEQTEKGIFANARCHITVFATDDSGFPIIKTAFVNLHVPIDEAVGMSSFPDIILSIEGCSGHISEGELICSFDICLCGVISEKNTVMAVSGFEDAEADKNQKKSEIIVYYPAGDDTVWSVAKKYRVNPESLQSINGIENGNVSGKKILLIP